MNKRIIHYFALAIISIIVVIPTSYLISQPLDSLWMHYYGSDSISEFSYDMIQKSDSGYLIVGIIETNYPELYDAFIISVDKYGELLWEQNISSPGKDIFNEIVGTSDSSYLVGGSYNELAWLIKMNDNGDTLWSKSYGSSFGEITSLQELPNNDLIITGNPNNQNYNFYMMKTDQNGDSIWSRKYIIDTLYGSSFYRSSRCVKQTSDGGYMLLTGGVGGYGELFSIIVKTDLNGDTLWTMEDIYGIYSATYLTDILIEEDTVYIIGRVNPSSSEGSILILKMKYDGEILWINYYNDQYSSQWSGYYGTFTPDNTIYIAGSPHNYEQMIYIFEIEKKGDLIWEKYYGEIGITYKTIAISNCNNNSIAIAGYSFYAFGDIFIFKLGENPSQISTTNNLNNFDYNVFPNPSKSFTNIEFYIPNKALTQVTIYSLSGIEIEVLENNTLTKGEYSLQWNTGSVSNGIYFCKIEMQ